MDRVLWIFVAGGLGSVARYGVALWATGRWGAAIPYGTLLVNVVGCFLLAVVAHVALRVSAFPETLRLALATGFLGGLTTYSSFNLEALRMLEEGRLRTAVAYFGATTGACLAAAVLGLVVARRIVGA